MRRALAADYTLVALALVLSTFGIATVYSAGQTDISQIFAGLWRMQALYLALGLGAAWVVSRTTVRVLDYLSPAVYIGTNLMLVLLLFIGRGAGTAKSTKSWLYIGDVSIGQPSELAKIAVVIMLAKVLSSRGDAPKSLLDLWKPALVVGLPWTLIMLQPDLGTGLVFIGIFFAMLFWAGCDWKLLVLAASPVVSLVMAFSTSLWGAWFILLIALVIYAKPHILESVLVVAANLVMGVVAPLIWAGMDGYKQRRLLVFLDPSSDPLKGGYHVMQSQVAIGSGGWFGKGFGAGSQKRLGYLPEQHTDFIFPVVGEELGFSRCSRGTGAVCLAHDAVHPHCGALHEPLCEPRCVRARVDALCARSRKRRDDHRSHADHRNPAPLLQLWGVVHARLLDRGGAPHQAVAGRPRTG